MNEITVKAIRWSGGWELELDANHHTQTRTLANAQQQVRDYLDTESPNIDHSTWTIHIVPDIAELNQVEAARKATQDAAQVQLAAASQLRSVAQKLRETGLSMSDTAVILGVSKSRISQLAPRQGFTTLVNKTREEATKG